MLRVDGAACERGGRRILTQVGFELRAGEMLVLRGANGSGKSSLLRLLAGLVPLQAGEVEASGAGTGLSGHLLSGHMLSGHVLSESMIYSGHAVALKPSLTLFEHLRDWAGCVLGRLLSEADAFNAATLLDMQQLIDTEARFFSSGQRRRASLLRLLIGARPIWLMDEPTVGLDAANRKRLAAIMQAHLARGGMILAATHEDLGLEGRTLDIEAFKPQAPRWQDAYDDEDW